MKPVIFLNQDAENEYIRLIIKNNNDQLKTRLKALEYLQLHNKSGCYMIPNTEHYLQMLSDNTDDLALINTTYLSTKKVTTEYVRIDGSRTTSINQPKSPKPPLTILPLSHNGKAYALLKFPHNPAIYQRIKMLEYVKYSRPTRGS